MVGRLFWVPTKREVVEKEENYSFLLVIRAGYDYTKIYIAQKKIYQ